MVINASPPPTTASSPTRRRGGADIYISVGLGTLFRPPTIFVGPTRATSSRSSSNTRIHCVLNGDLPCRRRPRRHLTTNPYASGDAMSSGASGCSLRRAVRRDGAAAARGRAPRRLLARRRHQPRPLRARRRVGRRGSSACSRRRCSRAGAPRRRPGRRRRAARRGEGEGAPRPSRRRPIDWCNSRYASPERARALRRDASAAASTPPPRPLRLLRSEAQGARQRSGDAYAAQATKQLDVAGGATFDAEVLHASPPWRRARLGGGRHRPHRRGLGLRLEQDRDPRRRRRRPLRRDRAVERSLTCRIEALGADAVGGGAARERARRARRAGAIARRRRRRRRRRVRHTGVGAVTTQPSTIDGWFESPCDCDVTFIVRGGGAASGAARARRRARSRGRSGGGASAKWLRGRSPRRGGAPPPSLARCRSRRAGATFSPRAPPAPAAARSARAHTARAAVADAGGAAARRARRTRARATITSAACCAAVDAITTEPCVPAGAFVGGERARARLGGEARQRPHQVACPRGGHARPSPTAWAARTCRIASTAAPRPTVGQKRTTGSRASHRSRGTRTVTSANGATRRLYEPAYAMASCEGLAIRTWDRAPSATTCSG